MKSTKAFFFLIVLLIAGGISAYGQSWLERVSNSAKRANEAVQGVNDNKRACHSLKTMYKLSVRLNQEVFMADTAIIEKKYSWAKWGDGVTFSVDKDDIATINVVKESYIDNCGVGVPYNGVKNSTYKYSFQAWTKFGTREIRICFGSEKNASGHVWHPFEKITITSRKQTYQLEYKISGNWQDFTLFFNCGGAVGELYIKLISIDSANDIG